MKIAQAVFLKIAKRLDANSIDKHKLKNQNIEFAKMGLDRELGLSKINQICDSIFGQSYSETNGMWSEHLVLLASISESGKSIKNILEIGTFKGETTRLLASLFPNSKITSLDLEFDEVQKKGKYSYALEEMKSNSKIALKNVTFMKKNSLNLISDTSKYDLIWIDGDHRSPTVVSDIINSIRLLNKNGIAICDDVFLRKMWWGDKYSDEHSFKCLHELKCENIILLHFVYKRMGRQFNNVLVGSKKLGVAIKN